MIAPLPPQPGLPQPADPLAARFDARAEGDAFAEILAVAAAAAMPAPRVPGPPPAIEHGPAIARVADLVPAEPVSPAEPEAPVAPAAPTGPEARAPDPAPVQAALTDPAAETEVERPDLPRPAARIFNQDGFFGASIDGATGDTIPADAEGTPAAPRTALAPVIAPAQLPDDPPIVAPPIAAGAMPAPPAPAEIAAPVAALPRPSRTAPGPLTAPVAARPAVFDAEAESEPAGQLGRRLPVREPAARAAAQVAMRELEQGLHVAARAEGLDAAERVRLHEEIAALLARHGLSARSIRISAPVRGSSQERLK